MGVRVDARAALIRLINEIAELPAGIARYGALAESPDTHIIAVGDISGVSRPDGTRKVFRVSGRDEFTITIELSAVDHGAADGQAVDELVERWLTLISDALAENPTLDGTVESAVESGAMSGPNSMPFTDNTGQVVGWVSMASMTVTITVYRH